LYANAATGNDANACTKASAPCDTITAALAKLPVGGGTIQLQGAAPFVEQVDVTKNNVTITSALSGGSTIAPNTKNVNGAKPGGAAVIAMVHVAPSVTGFILRNVTVDGAGASFGCEANTYVGVYVHSAVATLKQVKVKNIQPASPDGCQNGVGVYVRSEPATTTTLTMNAASTVDSYNKNGITCADSGTTCKLTDVSVTGHGGVGVPLAAQNGVQVSGGAAATLTRVTSNDNAYLAPGWVATGLLISTAGAVTVNNSTFDGNNTGIYVISTDNVIIASSRTRDGVAQGDAYSAGIDLVDVSGARVNMNTSSNNPTGGINGWGLESSKVSGNTTTGNGFAGIYIGGYDSYVSTGNLVVSNIVQDNTNDGIQADVPSSGNTFRYNAMTNNHTGGDDIHDLSTGGGTLGTANAWVKNTCGTGGTSSPNGLCT
jgi:hypothetical protein